jgi:hypothetical protein
MVYGSVLVQRTLKAPPVEVAAVPWKDVYEKATSVGAEVTAQPEVKFTVTLKLAGAVSTACATGIIKANVAAAAADVINFCRLFILNSPQITGLKLETPEKSVFQQAISPLRGELHKPCQNQKTEKICSYLMGVLIISIVRLADTARIYLELQLDSGFI